MRLHSVIMTADVSALSLSEASTVILSSHEHLQALLELPMAGKLPI